MPLMWQIISSESQACKKLKSQFPSSVITSLRRLLVLKLAGMGM